MDNSFLLNEKVVLKSFHGSLRPTSDTRDDENYWRLLGVQGVVVSDGAKVHPAYPAKGPRVLVKFDVDPKSLGLNSHNFQQGSLWIFVSDLQGVGK